MTEQLFKVIGKDNFDREQIADMQVPGLENMTRDNARAAAAWLQRILGGERSDRFFQAVPQEYRLSRGMEDLV